MTWVTAGGAVRSDADTAMVQQCMAARGWHEASQASLQTRQQAAPQLVRPNVPGEEIRARFAVVEQECRNRGDLSDTWLRAVQCLNTGYRQALMDLHHPDMDLADQWLQRRLALAEELDAHPVSPEVARTRFERLWDELVAGVHARNLGGGLVPAATP
jgi:hypothetical protein